MNKSQEEIDEIRNTCQKEILRLEKMQLNIYSVAIIRYWYWKLSHFRKSPNLFEDIMGMEALTTSIVISHGRLFGEGTGTAILKKKCIPQSLLPLHSEIINLRHAKYAHHGEHKTVEKIIELDYDGSAICVTPRLDIELCFGAPKEWGILFKWLDEYMYDRLSKQLTLLTSKTSVKWKMPQGEPPYWVQ
jgi:hypothetical protein